MKACLLLGLCSLLGLGLGVVGPALPHASTVTVAALGVQTFLTVGALPGIRGRWRAPLRLLGIHVLTVTAVLALIAWSLGTSGPLGLGALLLAIVPPAAGLPAYADAAGARVRTVTHYCLSGYLVALAATPLAAWLLLGGGIDATSLLVSLGGGLLLPTVAGRAARPFLTRIPAPVRRALAAVLLGTITYTVGNAVAPALLAIPGPGIVLAAAAVAVVRTFGSGVLAATVWRRGGREAMLAGGFKNAALAAATALVLGHPLAALPAMLSFPFESLWLIVVARTRSPGTARIASGRAELPDAS